MKRALILFCPLLLMGCVTTQKYATLESKTKANRLALDNQMVENDRLKEDNLKLKEDVLSLIGDTIFLSNRLRYALNKSGRERESGSIKTIIANRKIEEYMLALKEKEQYVRELKVQTDLQQDELDDKVYIINGYIQKAFGNSSVAVVYQESSSVVVEFANSALFTGSELSKGGKLFSAKVAQLIRENESMTLRVDSYSDVYKTKKLISVAEGVAMREAEVTKRETDVIKREQAFAIKERARKTTDSIAYITPLDTLSSDDVALVALVPAENVAIQADTTVVDDEHSTHPQLELSLNINKRWYYNGSAGFVIAQDLYDKGVSKSDVSVLINASSSAAKRDYSDKTVLRFVLDSEYIITLLNSIVNN